MEPDRLEKLYYSISEVADLTGVKPHILRFWEKDFSVLRPRKNRAQNRAYRERDIRIVLAIRRLLYEEKYTIKGARDRLLKDRTLIDDAVIPEPGGGEPGAAGPDQESPESHGEPESQPGGKESPHPVHTPSPCDSEVIRLNRIVTDLRHGLKDLLHLIDKL